MSGAINLRKQVVVSIGNKKTYNLAHLLESDGLKTFPFGIPHLFGRRVCSNNCQLKFSSANLNLFVFLGWHCEFGVQVHVGGISNLNKKRIV